MIAENYDDDEDDSSSNSNQSDDDHEDKGSSAPKKSRKTIEPVVGCPNKTNVYHDCTDYCWKRWGLGKDCPSPKTERRYRRMLKRFPLTDEWQDVWEPGTGRYYFWNTKTDEVSWLPPHHPDSKVTVSVERMKLLLVDKNRREESDVDSDNSDSSGSSDGSDSEESPDESSKIQIPEPVRRGAGFQSNRRPPVHRRPAHQKLDPMDPSSYSETCPVGDWKQGLGLSDD